MKIGLQMISVKDIIPSDLCEVIREVGAIGYQGVEFARGYFGKTAAELKQVLDECRMECVGEHIYLDELETRFDECVKNWEVLHVRRIAPLRGLPKWVGKEDLRIYTDRLMKLAYRLEKYGIRMVLHGSANYFQRDEDGVTLFDRVLTNIEPRYLEAQVDTAWAVCGGVDPAALIRKWKDRISIVHMKDFHPPIPVSGDVYARKEDVLTRDSAFGDSGVVDIPSVLAAAGEANAQWLVVEHMEREKYSDSLAATSISYANLKREVERYETVCR